MNDENLTPVRDEEEARRLGRKGGIASGKARRQRKAMRETLEIMMSMPLKGGKNVDIGDVKSFAALKGKNINVSEALALSILQNAMNGNVKAFAQIMELMGENKPGRGTKENNLLEVILAGTMEDMDTDDIPEIEQAADPDFDMVE